MSHASVGIAEPFPDSISDQERRWAILRWLSAKLGDAPQGDILEAAQGFEEFVAANLAGRRISQEALSKIEKIEETARRVLTGEVDFELEFEELGAPMLRKPNRISRNPPRWPHRR